MNSGDKVTGVPAEANLRKKHPTVTGFYEDHVYEFGGETFKTEFVMVQGIALDCTDIRPATRREKETVLK